MSKQKDQPKLNLYQKLVEIRKCIPYVHKSADGYGYKYAQESVILGLIREEMDNQGVILYQDMEECEFLPEVYVETKKGPMRTPAVRLRLKYTWINAENPEERIEATHFMQEPGADAKTIGAIMTYSNKYFLLKFLNVPTDKDDPDSFERKVVMSQPKALVTKEQVDELLTLIGERKEAHDTILSHWKVKSLEALPADVFSTVSNWLKAAEATNGKS